MIEVLALLIGVLGCGALIGFTLARMTHSVDLWHLAPLLIGGIGLYLLLGQAQSDDGPVRALITGTSGLILAAFGAVPGWKIGR